MKTGSFSADRLKTIPLYDVLFSIFIVILVVFMYWNSTYGAFIWDDRAAIIANNDVKGKTPLLEIFNHDFWGQNIKLSDSHKSFRPITTLTFRFDHSIYALNAYGYHFTNIFIYALTCLMMYAVSLQWFQSHAAKLATMLFTVHPVHVEAVSSIVGRADCLCGLLYLTTMYLYTLAVRKETSTQPQSFLWSWLYFVGSIVTSLLACFSKEIGVTVFTVLMVIEVLEHMKPIVGKHKQYKIQHVCSVTTLSYTPSTPNTTTTTATTATIPLDTLPRIGYFPKPSFSLTLQLLLRTVYSLITSYTTLFRLILLLISLISFFQFRIWLNGTHTLYTWTMMENHIALQPLLSTRILSYGQSHFWYFMKLCYPYYLCFDYGYDCIPMISHLFDIRNVLPLFVYSIIVILLYYAIQHLRITLLLALVTFILPLIPALNIFVSVGTILAERLLFIPSIGFCWLVVELLLYDSMIYWDRLDKVMIQWYEFLYTVFAKQLASMETTNIVNKVPKPSSRGSLFRAFYAFFFPLCLLCIIRVISRNIDWQSEINIYSSALQVCPHSVKALSNYALLVLAKDEVEKGTITALKAIELLPHATAGLVNGGVAYQRVKAYLPSIELYEKCIGLSLVGGNKNTEGGSSGTSGLKALGYLGNSLYSYANTIDDPILSKGLLTQAIFWLEESIRLGFQAPSILHLAGSAAFDLGNIPLAISFYEKTLMQVKMRAQDRHGSNDVPIEDEVNVIYTYNQLGNCYSQIGNITSAIDYYEQGLLLDATNVVLLSNLSILYKDLKQYDKARKALLLGIQASESDPFTPGSLYNNLGTLELDVGNYPNALIYFEKALVCVRKNKNNRMFAGSTGGSGSGGAGLPEYRYDVEGNDVEIVILNNIADVQRRMEASNKST